MFERMMFERMMFERMMFKRMMFERMMFERMMFEREAREYYSSHPLTQRTCPSTVSLNRIPQPYPSLAIISIERFHFFLGYAIDRHDRPTR